MHGRRVSLTRRISTKRCQDCPPVEADGRIAGVMKQVHDPVHNEVLGTMLWDEGEGGWVTRPVLASFRIVVAGTQGPDATLLPAARALTADARQVAAEVSSLLEAFAHRLPEAASEVLALQLQMVIRTARETT